MGFETPPEQKPAFPKLVDAVKEEWSFAVAQQPDNAVDHNDVAQVVAERLNNNQNYLFDRRAAGINGPITPEEVLSTKSKF